MTETHRLLVIGHSHTFSLLNAAPGVRTISMQVLNLHKLSAKGTIQGGDLANEVERQALSNPPDAVCLLIGGQFHNTFGLNEQAPSLAIGHEERGVVPQDDTPRVFIPFEELKAHIHADYQTDSKFNLVPLILKKFPHSDHIVLPPPPPVADRQAVAEFLVKQGASPNVRVPPPELRRRLYDATVEVYHAMARENGARFLSVHDRVVDGDGLLRPEFHNWDVVHANAAYGRILLEHIVDHLNDTRTRSETVS